MRCPSSCDATRADGRAYRPARIVAIGLVLLAVPAVTARAALPSNAEVEQAVLAADTGPGSLKENWQPVVRRLAEVSEQTPDPVLRMVKGHACLAANENNESVCLFLSVQTPKDQKQWLQWAEDFADRNPDAPIALYYKGDALARLGKWKDATACFTSAVDHAPNKHHALARNARGVVYAHQGELTRARLDFAYAVSCSGSLLADAHANIGDVRIQKKSGLKGAIEAFDRALEHSPKFVLALHGKACVKAANALEITDPEKKALAAALQECPSDLLKKLMLANAERIKAFWEGREKGYFLAMLGSGDEAGTTIESSISSPFQRFKDDVDNGVGHFEGFRQQHEFNSGIQGYAGLTPEQQQASIKDLGSWAGDDPTRQAALNQALGRVEDTNGPFGSAHAFSDSAKLVGAALAAETEGASLALPGGAMVLDQLTEQNWHSAEQLRNGLGPLTPSTPDVGGVDMNLADIHHGVGIWPFIGYYALAYDIVKFEEPFAYTDGLRSRTGHLADGTAQHLPDEQPAARSPQRNN